jgi:RND family efflux transporter MFP subunit
VHPLAAWRHRLLTLAALGIIAAGGGCGGGSNSATLEDSALGVTARVVKRETLRDVANASGTVVPSPAGDWTVYAPDVAEIVELPKAEGETVATGDVLARFEIASRTQELAALQLEVIAAEQAVERAAAELTQQTSLVERGLLARTVFENTRARHSAAQNQLGQLRARLESARSGQDLTVVRARFPGIVMKVFRAKGETVSGPADPVLRVVDPSRVQVAIQLPLAQLARVFPGQTATVRAIAGATDEPAFVALAPGATDPNAPTGEVRLAFQNPVALPLDTPVSASLLLDVRSDVIAVPSAAVQTGELGPYVMLVSEQGLAERRDVRVGLAAGELTHIVAGLTEGETVVVSGLTDESAGLPVRVGE